MSGSVTGGAVRSAVGKILTGLGSSGVDARGTYEPGTWGAHSMLLRCIEDQNTDPNLQASMGAFHKTIAKARTRHYTTGRQEFAHGCFFLRGAPNRIGDPQTTAPGGRRRRCKRSHQLLKITQPMDGEARCHGGRRTLGPTSCSKIFRVIYIGLCV